ncbi:helix-turn-helix transcriptional regulator [Christiangramia sabulilitoris]|uniref:Helix-turn-helix transcriptional regulator n=1 Tax=Christiangramia sabulilitoris TaxID=2583991 RepID=A0A550I5Z6_9FLAO|nr:AraC family transcriptional regulator [Christiangramia sabulilitoris]TRO66399.1 helix-turn-helix transcriptional regulator [Christiangramia sabulilitoris]
MDIIRIINLILIAGVVQGFVFNIYTIYISRKKPGWAVIYLNLTVLALSLNNLQAWLIEISFSSNNFYFEHLLVPWYLFILPTFHAFLINYLRIKDRVKSFMRLAFNIFTAEILIRSICIAYVYFRGPYQDISLITNYTIFEEIFNALFSLYIFFKCVQIVFKGQELYSYILKFDKISWLRIFLRLGGFVFILWIVAIIGHNITGNQILNYPLRLGTSILIYWIGYQGFYRYHKVKDRISIRRSLEENSALKLNDEKSRALEELSTEVNSKMNEEFLKIDKYLIDNQSYLDPSLSLDKLAEEMDLSPSNLSRIVNSFSGHGFPDYINSLRIEQAKKLLRDDDFCMYTVVSIGLECGFNSRSTFYSAFKKFTSTTPTEYREST